MPAEKKAEMRKRENAASQERRRTETPEQRERRLSEMRKRAARIRASESPERRIARLAYLREYKPRYAEENKSKIAKQSKEWYARCRESILEKCRKYRAANKALAYRRHKAKLKSNVQYMIASRLRHRVYMAIRSAAAKKSARTIELAGCTADELVGWLESQFVDEMSWSNAGKWHIDHGVPCAAFDLADESQQRIAFHYTNLRPLWAKENCAKRDRLVIQKPEGRRWSLSDIARAKEACPAPRTA